MYIYLYSQAVIVCKYLLIYFSWRIDFNVLNRFKENFIPLSRLQIDLPWNIIGCLYIQLLFIPVEIIYTFLFNKVKIYRRFIWIPVVYLLQYNVYKYALHSRNTLLLSYSNKIELTIRGASLWVWVSLSSTWFPSAYQILTTGYFDHSYYYVASDNTFLLSRLHNFICVQNKELHNHNFLPRTANQ